MYPDVYLAGPDVFLPNALEVGRRKVDLCRQAGLTGLFPMDQDKESSGRAEDIFLANCALMQRARMGLFNLTPFRGPSLDAGTAFEVGYMASMGKPLFGYSASPLSYERRVERSDGPLQAADGRSWDRNGYAVEDFGLADNLMIARAIIESGGAIVTVAEEGPGALAAFAAFEVCLDKVSKARSSVA